MTGNHHVELDPLHPSLASGSRLPAGATDSSYESFFLCSLQRHITEGQIEFVTPRGRTVVGHGGQRAIDSTPVVEVSNPDFFRRVLCAGNLGMAESYMAGDFNVKDGRLPELLTLLLRNRLDKKLKQDKRFLARYLWIKTINRLSSNAENVRAHYDVGDELFDCFLSDKFQVYSCGYAQSWGDEIDDVQRNKLDRICRKLELRPGQRLLDIGSGNGGLLIHAAQNYGVVATGVTNSRSHYKRSSSNIEKYHLQKQLDVHLGDFTAIAGDFDRVVSVGMLEHVRPSRYSAYFKKIRSLLRPAGWGLVHCIGMNAAENKNDPFIQKYIFPGSHTPKLSVIAANIESNDMAIIDVENIARHYAVTTRRWLESFRRNHHRLTGTQYDGAFKRMWDYYLSCGVAVATAGELAVYQVLFTNDYHTEYRFQRI